MRAVSTVLDVTLCLLLIGAAIATLTVPAPGPTESTADDTLDRLLATTGNASESVPARPARHPRERRSYGTPAELLARATLANLTLDGHSLNPATAGYRRAVRTLVRRALEWAPIRTSIAATWEPYPGSPVRGRLTVGPRPPSGVRVGTARADVPVPWSLDRPPSSGSYRAVARPVSAALLRTTTPGPSARASRRLRPRERGRLSAYASALAGLDGTPPSRLSRARIRGALTDRLASDMRQRFDRPTAAAKAVEGGTVTVVVWEWEP